MRLLVFTQALDTNDPVLSAYNRLVSEMAKNFDSIVVVCLKKGANKLPMNVKVLSLGKELDGNWFIAHLRYVGRFFKYIFTERYDAVFVHMNQEYVLLGGLFWKITGKPIYMWRNHHAGSFLTDIAADFCKKVFCTSKFSYTAKYKQTVLMPVGVDTDFFKPVSGLGGSKVTSSTVIRTPHSILFLARMAPAKKPDILVSALAILKRRGVAFSADFYGDPLPRDRAYYDSVKEMVAKQGLSRDVVFHGGIRNDQTPAVYNTHEIFVNLSSSGMYDKTIFEAMACETVVLATNKNLEGLIDARFIAREDNVEDIAVHLGSLLKLGLTEREMFGKELRSVADGKHSLRELGEKLAKEISQKP